MKLKEAPVTEGIALYTVSHKNVSLCFSLYRWHFLSDCCAFCISKTGINTLYSTL